MTLEKAITILTEERQDHHSLATDVIGRAEALAIEALALVRFLRDTEGNLTIPLLKGETEN